MKPNRRDERPSAPTPPAIEAPPPSPFLGPFRCVGMARTTDGFVTVTVDFGADGLMTGLVLGRPQSAPHGQPYVAAEAKKLLMMQCLGV